MSVMKTKGFGIFSLIIKLQSHDMLNYREIGQVGFETYVSGKILKQVSTKAPLRKKSCVHSLFQKRRNRG